MQVAADEAPIDPTAPNAKELLEERYPHIVSPLTIKAPDSAEKWAQVYMRAHTDIKKLEAEKENAANHLRLMIADSAGLDGVTFQAAWAEVEGSVDWKKVAMAMKAPARVINKHRRDGSRRLSVTPKV